jgi:hypothetical protein
MGRAMGKYEEISEVTRADVGDDWVVTRSLHRTADKFGLTTKAVKQIVFDAAAVARLPENVKATLPARFAACR